MPVKTLNLKHVGLPGGWDATELTRLTLADGTTYQQIVKDIDDGLQIAGEMLMQSYAAQLISITDEPALEYGQGASGGFTRITERGKGEGTRGATGGHMLPLLGWDAPLFWTYLFLKNARRRQLDENVDNIIRHTKDVFEKQVYTRFFKMEEETGHYFGLGASGYSVPFCDGGAGTQAFTPKAYPDRGGTFAASHDHYLRLNGITQANLESAVAALWEHGVDGPYDLVASYADLSSWTNTTNVTGYIERPDPSVAYGNSSELANVSDIYQGGVKTDLGFVRLKTSGRVPTGYWGVTKVHGVNDPRNPLKVRVEKGRTMVTPELIVENMGSFPLQGAVPMIFFGVGVGEMREAAVLVENDSSGDYATPTIS